MILITLSGGDPSCNRSVISWIETDSSDSDRGEELLYSVGTRLGMGTQEW